MSSGPDELRAKLVQIAGRYLERMTREVVQLRALIENAASGNVDVIREIETLTHRMHGSGAMLQFDEISSRAGELERQAASSVASGTVDHPRMVETLGQLQTAIDKAVSARSAP